MSAVVELATTSSAVKEVVDPMTEPLSVPSTFLGEARFKAAEEGML